VNFGRAMEWRTCGGNNFESEKNSENMPDCRGKPTGAMR